MKYLLCIILSFALLSCETNKKVSNLTLSSNTLSIQIGETKQLELFIYPTSATAYSSPRWTSSDTNTAQVDNKGNITAIYSGECIITVSCGEIKSECLVSVITPKYELTLHSAYAKLIEDENNATSKIYSLKLLDKNLHLNTNTNNIEGNGLMLNIELKSSWENPQIDTGIYTISSNNTPQTFTPGELTNFENNYYATGTYLGEYSDNGLSAIFIKKGTIKIGKEDNKWNIQTFIEGEKGEVIQSSFSDTIMWLNSLEESETIELQYDNATITQAGYSQDTKRALIKLTLQCQNHTTITQHLVIPISSGEKIPQGKYSTSDTERNFTIVLNNNNNSTNPSILEQNIETPIVSGEIFVSQSEGKTSYTLQYKDSNNRIIYCVK